MMNDDAMGGDAPGASYAQIPRQMTGAEIVELRSSVGWSQARLAREIGYSQSHVSRWEHDQQPVSFDAASAILQVVNAAQQALEQQRLSRYHSQRWLRRGAQKLMHGLGIG